MRDRFYSRFLHGRDPIRALYVVPSGGFGGLERQVSCVLPQLPSWGVEVLPLVGPDSTLVTCLEAEGLKEIVHSQAFELPDGEAGAMKRLVSLGFAWRGARRIGEEVERLIHERSIDVVVAAGPVGWLAASEATRRLGLPLVWWAPDAPGRGERALVRGLCAFTRPEMLLCASQGIEQAWSPMVHAPSEVVEGAVDLNHFRRGKGPARLRPGAAREVVGFAGRLVAEKHVEHFVDMAAQLAPHFPQARFLVAGEGPQRVSAEEQARARGLGDKLQFLGFVRDMRSFYSACDVVVLPSEQERPAQALIEAMAMQVPVVTTDRVARASLPSPSAGGSAELPATPIGDVTALCQQVSALLAAPEGRAALVARGYERVRREFDAQRTARRTARLLQTLVAWSGATPTVPQATESAARAASRSSRPRLELAT